VRGREGGAREREGREQREARRRSGGAPGTCRRGGVGQQADRRGIAHRVGRPRDVDPARAQVGGEAAQHLGEVDVVGVLVVAAALRVGFEDEGLPGETDAQRFRSEGG